MIRAIDKMNKSFVYIYYIYEAYNHIENKICTYYLCSCENYVGLLAMREDEIERLEVLKENYIRINESDASASVNDLIHPALYFLLEEHWKVYEGVVEGVLESWLVFEKELGHRP